MKFDADFMKKNLFWVLLCVAVPVTLIAVIMLATVVGGTISTARKKVEDDKKAFEAAGEVKNKKWVEAGEKKLENFKKEEKKVWQNAEKTQSSLSTWPERFEKEFGFQNGKHAVKIEQATGGEEQPVENPPAEGEQKPPATDGDPETPQAPPQVPDSAKEDEEGVNRTIVGELTTAPDNKRVTIKINKATQKRLKLDNDTVSFLLTEETQKETRNNSEVYRKGAKVRITYRIGRYFGEKMTREQVTAFQDSYRDQLESILSQVAPADDTGKGIVQLNGWKFKMPPQEAGKYLVFFDGNWDFKQDDFFKEAWTAQEDLWIQRELYRLVKLANDYVADFEFLGDKEKIPAGMEKVNAFKNPYWKMSLQVQNGRLVGQIENLLQRRQRLDVTFWVRLKKDSLSDEDLSQKILDREKDREDYYMKIKVAGTPLDPGQNQPIDVALPRDLLVEFEGWEKKDADAKKKDPIRYGVLGVTQELTTETAAIKRIDEITIGSGVRPSKGRTIAGGKTVPGDVDPKGGVGGNEQGALKKGLALSHRTMLTELQKFAYPGGGGSTELALPVDPMGDPTKAMMGQEKPLDLTTNGFDLKRYIKTEQEARRIPVGISLVVDQHHVGRVQAAFANSRLRFLTHQVLLNRYPYSLDLSSEALAKSGSGEIYQVENYGVSGAAPKTSSVGEGSQSANVEVVIYGVVSLYNRYPPLPADGGTTP